MTRDPTRLREAMRRAPRPLQERMARAHDEEVHPLWGERFAELTLRAVAPGGAPLGGAVLELGCNAGTLTAELVARHRGSGRIVAVDAAAPMLDRARVRVRGKGETPVFFRPHDPVGRLPFAEETFDVVVAGPALAVTPDWPAAIEDLARVTAPGGRVVVATPVAGTWEELLDIYAEVLRRPDRRAAWAEAATALYEHRVRTPDSERLAALMEAAGLVDVAVETTRWELLFRSGREFFYAPVIETGPLPDWRAIAAHGGDVLEIFVALKDAIDTYYAGQVFAVTVVAACATARKPGVAARPAAEPKS